MSTQHVEELACFLVLALTTNSEKNFFQVASRPIGGVTNYLVHLFKYRSLKTYCSAVTSVHEKADGYEVGEHHYSLQGDEKSIQSAAS